MGFTCTILDSKHDDCCLGLQVAKDGKNAHEIVRDFSQKNADWILRFDMKFSPSHNSNYFCWKIYGARKIGCLFL